MKKTLLFGLAWLLLIVGGIGIVVPILPTTPFVILAALCFARSNESYYKWLCRTKLFGAYIENYQTKQGISLKTKFSSMILLWSLILCAILLKQDRIMAIILVIIACLVTIHIGLIKRCLKVE